MKRHFILDENVIILAQKLEDDRGNKDSTCLELIICIEKYCHSLVLAPCMIRQYSVQMTRLKRQGVPVAPNVVGLVTTIIRNLDKDAKFLGDEQLYEITGLEEPKGV